jgi:hypothetical protein
VIIILKKFKLILLISLIIPLNIYVIGDFLGAGITFPFLKFQITFMGTFFLTFLQELNYVINGTFHHKTAISVLFWTIALIIQVAAVLTLYISWNRQNFILLRRAGVFLMTATILYLASIITQYGFLFHGPAGTAIPIGLPVLFLIGGWMYMEGQKEEVVEEEEEVQGIDEESG